jgi:hypothetical protein
VAILTLLLLSIIGAALLWLAAAAFHGRPDLPLFIVCLALWFFFMFLYLPLSLPLAVVCFGFGFVGGSRLFVHFVIIGPGFRLCAFVIIFLRF